MALSLKTCSLEELKKEPWRLQIQAENTAEQLRNLVLKNYHVFIQSNQCSNLVKDDLSNLKDGADRIVEFIPELKTYCAKFQNDIASVVAKHGDIQFVFEHYLQLTELLEIPQLLEACIHNELFDSALDVIQFANDIFQTEEKGTAIPNFVLLSLVREVAQMTSLLRDKLLQKLREDLQLSLCVRIVSYLRRLDMLVGLNESIGTPEYERQLKEEFLSCRNVWLASLTRSISTADPYQYIIQVIDMKRTSWFDMITQYSAIFGSENIDGKVDPPLCRWATTTVADFLQILTKQLPKIDDFSALATIFEQSLFFGGSLGRVGVDFRAVLVVYFEDHIMQLITEDWRNACREFQENLDAHSLVGIGNSLPSSSKTPIVIASYRSSVSSNGFSPFLPRTTPSGEEDFTPPRCLMSFPILAEFTNAILTSLNELRLCTIASLQNRLAKKFQEALHSMLQTIADFARDNNLILSTVPAQNNNSVDGESRSNNTYKVMALSESMRDMNEVIRSDLIPYLIKCFHRLFPVPAGKGTGRVYLHAHLFEQVMQEYGLLVTPESEAKNEVLPHGEQSM